MRRKWGTVRAASIIALLAIFGIVNGSHLSLTLIAASRPSAGHSEAVSAGHSDADCAMHFDSDSAACSDTPAPTGPAALATRPASAPDDVVPPSSSGPQR